MSDKNILSLQKKEQLAEAVRMKKVRGKDKKVFGGKFTGKSYRESEAVIWRYCVKKLFLEISQNSPGNTCARVLF